MSRKMAEIIRTIIKSPNAPTPIGPYNQAVRVGNTIYLSGSIGTDPQTGKLVEGGIELEARQAFKNIAAVLEHSGCTFNNVVKSTVLLADINDFQTLNKVYAEQFSSHFPARSTYQVANLPLSSRVEIECIVAVGEIVDA
jgi:reactive intermediate/imine deaminase